MKVGFALDTKRDLSIKLNRLVLCVLFQTYLIIALPVFCAADDKNGVAPNTISLPSGPGSIEGLGESFQPMLNTGTAKYSVNIALPPGAGGHSPSLSLRYESGHGDGPAGLGWKFGPGAVCRKTDKGIPRYVDSPNGLDDDNDGEIDENDEADILLGIEDEELVRLADGTYRARIEGTFVRYRRVGDHWEGHLKDGTQLLFGLTSQSRITDQTGTKIFKWLLDTSTDTNGNVIEFYYENFPGSDNQKYLTEIRYGPGASPWTAFYFARFTYEDRPDWRKDYRSGFLIKTAKRLIQIDLGIQGVLPEQCAQGDWNSDSTSDALIRRYTLSYDPDQTRSYLTRVTRYGADGINYLPPVSFSYSVFSPELTMSASGTIMTSTTAPPTVMDSDLVDLVDLNRDGLPDMLQTDLYGAGQTYYLNLGENRDGDSPEIQWDDGHAVASSDGLSLLLHLVDEKVHLADMDGNGISDLIHTPYTQDVYYYLNHGDGSWGERKKMSIQDTAPPAPFTNDDVKTSDLDFDKRMDVVQSTDNGYTVWFNRGEGKYSREVRTAGASHGGQVIRFSHTAVHLEDLNGDRMNDVARIRPTQVIYCANMGHGLFDEAVEIPIQDTVLTDGSNGQVERAKLKDINGDGLADLVLERAQANELWYWLNLGTDTFSAKHIITDMPTVFGKDMVTRWADINGNGTTDLIYADSTATSRLMALDIGELAGGSAHANLLTDIDNGLGVVTEITYESSTEFYLTAKEAGLPWSLTVPFPVSVIAQVRTTTGLDVDTVPGVDEYVKTYSYRDGFYEDREKAFRGFSQVTITELGDSTAPTRVTTHSFYTGGPDGVDNDGDGDVDEVSTQWYREEDALKGLVQAIAIEAEDGFRFSEEKNEWRIKNLALGPDDIEVRFAYKEAKEKWVYEGTQTPETVRATFLYDDFGNVTEERNYGALSIAGDEAFTFTEYINDTTLWILGLPQRQYTTNEALQIFSESRSYYDGPDYIGLSLGQVTAGNLTRQEGWIEGVTYVDLVRNAYDGFGNIVGIRDPNGHDRIINYDSDLHTYPVQEDIQVGSGNPDLSVIAAYNLGLGVVASSTGFNGHQTTYGHDTFGRLTSIVQPGDSVALPTLAFSYTMADPENGLVYAYDADGVLTLAASPPVPSAVKTRAREISGQAGTFDTIGYVDGLGRKLATVEEGEMDFIVRNAVLFNTMGSVHSTFMPYNKPSPDYALPVPGDPAVETHYDAAGREILSINPPDADAVITSAATVYQPLANTVTDENSNSKDFLYDGFQRLVAVHEQNQGQIYITRYAYDPLGNLTQITDAQDNIKTVEYDGRSRKTAINDPDRGRMDYTYDHAGNLVQTVDNKGQTIVFTYDGVNRMLTEDYMDGSPRSPDIAYHYDITSSEYPGTTNTRGRLAWVDDLSGGAFFSYDERGNMIGSVKRIEDTTLSQDFLFTSEYDAMNRVISNTFPDGDRVEYVYNPRSFLESIPGIVNNLDYYPSGKPDSIRYANNLTSTYAYDPRTRMTGLMTDATVPTGSPIQDLSYAFDGVSNITDITDNRMLVPDAPENASQTFSYDDLYRLTRAEGPGYGAIDFQYDRIGNMTFKGSPTAPDPQYIDDPLVNLGTMSSGGVSGTTGRGVRLPGDPPGPHAVTGTQSGLVFDYDDNGNMTDHNGDVYEWDFKDRLIRTTTLETVADYIYDYSGQRVIKRSLTNGEQKVVYYPGNTFEIRDGKSIKYVFDGSRRIARIEGRMAGEGETAWQVLNLRTGWNFFSLDVEPDETAIATALSPLAGQYTEVWTFDASAQQYVGYVPGQGINDLTEIHAQQGYIIDVTTPTAVLISGTRATNDISLEAGWNLIPCPTDTQTPLVDALAAIDGAYDAVWEYDPTGNIWRGNNPFAYAFLNNLDTMSPGKAYWVNMTAPSQLAFQQEQHSVHFYHPDHLGSSSVVTDGTGAVVERTEFYPFGRPRHEEHMGFDSFFKHSGKELDGETDLYYYIARYYEPVVGKFISVDPLATDVSASPAKAIAYGAFLNNPLIFQDPTGREVVIDKIVGDSIREENYSESRDPTGAVHFESEQEAQKRMEQETFEALRNEAMDRWLKSMTNEEFLAYIQEEEEIERQRVTGPDEGPPEVLFVGYVPFVGWIAEQLQESEESYGPLYGPGEEPSQETLVIRIKDRYYEMRVLGQGENTESGQERRMRNLGYSAGSGLEENVTDFQRMRGNENRVSDVSQDMRSYHDESSN